jgi:hypothetical protein
MSAVRTVWERRARTFAISPWAGTLVVVAVVVAAIGGWTLAGRLTSAPPAAAPSVSRAVHVAATVDLTLRAGWRPAVRTFAVPGLDAGAHEFAPADGSPGRLVVSLQRGSGLPGATVAALRVPLGGAARARVAGRPAVAYTGLSLRGVPGLTDVYAIPTAAGTLTVACVTPLADPLPPGTCPGDVLSVAAWAPDDGAAIMRARAPAIARRLDSARVLDRAALRRVRTAAGQVHAASHLAVAYDAAARAVRAVRPTSAAGTRLGNALAAAASAYRRLSAAAGRRDRGAWLRARHGVYAAEHGLRAALRF